MKYTIHMDVQYDFLELIDVPRLIECCTEKWYNQTLCRVNDSIVRLGVFNEGEFHWHKHDDEDEFFFVLKGELFIEIEVGADLCVCPKPVGVDLRVCPKSVAEVSDFHFETISLKQHQGITIPKGVLHRPYVKEPTAVIMVEKDTVIPIGDG